MKDYFNRDINYLRLSVTQQCNLRCLYCMKKNEIIKEDTLNFDEYYKLIDVLTELGINKIKITGGEPLVRSGIDEFLENLIANKTLEDITLTTNGLLIDKYWATLRNLSGINISLDTLQESKYKRITRFGDFNKIMSNINLVLESGYQNLKINTVLIKGINDDEIESFAKLALKYPVAIKFIELMPIGEAVNFTGIKREEIIERLEKCYGKYIWSNKKGNGPAQYIMFDNFKGSIGFIDAIDHKFCDECNRIRMLSNGDIILCLHHNKTISVKGFLNGDIDKDYFKEVLINKIYYKPQKNSFEKSKLVKNMNTIGG